MAESIFSKEALEKLRSPDRLDLMMPITKPIHWMIIVAVGVFLFSVILWSIFGAFTVTASGMGLIMDYGGVVVVTSSESNGVLSSLFVKSGMPIKRGDHIAHIDSQASTDTILSQQKLETAESEREAIEDAYNFDTQRIRQINLSNIYSMYEGIVDEVMVRRGDVINPGTPICTIRLTRNTNELNGILYIPVEKGKRVEEGMMIQLAPNGIDVKESGSLMGVVRHVSQYPVTTQSLKMHLGNPQLAQWISSSQGSALMEVGFDLIEDDSSESGYLWTSVVGDHKPITPGSFCTGSIVIERQAPIEKVFYKISQWLRSR